MATTAELLDLTVITTRAEGVRFDLLDQHNTVIGEIQPVQPAQVDNTATQTPKRRLTNFQLTATDAAAVNTLTDRVRPWWVLENGDELPLGIFLFADAATSRESYGLPLSASLVDQGLILNQTLASSIGFGADTPLSTAIRTTFEAAGIYGATIESSPAVLGAPLAYPAGSNSATYSKILDDLAVLGGYHSPYFDNEGNATVRGLSILSSASLSYLDGGRIISGTITEANDLLTAPNRLIVVDTSATSGPIAATWDIPDSAPHAYNNRGFRITRTVEAPGVGSVEAALIFAQNWYSTTTQAYETATWSSPADPRHDTFDPVNYRGTIFLEVAWSLKLAPGGPMAHKAVRVYL